MTSPSLSRRQFLSAAASTAAFAGFGGTALRAQTSIAIEQQVWTGAQELVPQQVAAAFNAAHPGVSVTVAPGSSQVALNKLVAARQAGANPPFNLGFFNLENTARGLAEDIWEPLTPDAVPHLDLIEDRFRQLNDVGAFPWIDLGGIIYNRDLVPEPPTSWKDLFDPKFHGRVAMFDGFWTGNGLIATAKVNGGSEDDVEPALAIYEEAARSGHIHSLFTSNAQIQQLLASGEVWIAPHFRGIVRPWIREGAPFGYAAPKEGQILFPEGFQLIKGAPEEHRKVAAALLNESLSRENIIAYAEAAEVVPVFKDGWLPEALKNEPALAAEALSRAIQPDYAKVAANSSAWADQWNRRVKANLA